MGPLRLIWLSLFVVVDGDLFTFRRGPSDVAAISNGVTISRRGLKIRKSHSLIIIPSAAVPFMVNIVDA